MQIYFKAVVAAFAAVFLFMTSADAETPRERGAYLATTIMACGNCHTPKDAKGQPIMDKDLSGGMVFATPGFTVSAANITPDVETGIGSWSAADIKTLITTGKRPNGVPVAIMTSHFYKALTAADLDALVTYLQSVPAVKHAVPLSDYKHELPPPTPYPDAERSYTAAHFKDPVERGRYLATIGHCMECHTEFNRGVLNFATGLGKGGRSFGPNTGVASNITSSKTAGIGAWSDAEIKRAITHGIGRDGHAFLPPMAIGWYAKMKDSDVNDLVAWLRTVPAID